MQRAWAVVRSSGVGNILVLGKEEAKITVTYYLCPTELIVTNQINIVYHSHHRKAG